MGRSRSRAPSVSWSSTRRSQRFTWGPPSPRASGRATRPHRPGRCVMKTGLNQSTQLKQELKINPRLYQAMDLLYMPLLDLQQHLKQELLNNPFLELVEPEEDEEEETAETEPAAEEPKEEEHKDEIDWEEI